MDKAEALLIGIVSSVISLAIIAVIVSSRAQTPTVIQAAGSALASVIGAAVAPVTGGGIAGALSPSTFGGTAAKTFGA